LPVNENTNGQRLKFERQLKLNVFGLAKVANFNPNVFMSKEMTILPIENQRS
jgi:hypothetical protein